MIKDTLFKLLIYKDFILVCSKVCSQFVLLLHSALPKFDSTDIN